MYFALLFKPLPHVLLQQFLYLYFVQASLVALMVKNLPAVQETWV